MVVGKASQHMWCLRSTCWNAWSMYGMEIKIMGWMDGRMDGQAPQVFLFGVTVRVSKNTPCHPGRSGKQGGWRKGGERSSHRRWSRILRWNSTQHHHHGLLFWKPWRAAVCSLSAMFLTPRTAVVKGWFISTYGVLQYYLLLSLATWMEYATIATAATFRLLLNFSVKFLTLISWMYRCLFVT